MYCNNIYIDIKKILNYKYVTLCKTVAIILIAIYQNI